MIELRPYRIYLFDIDGTLLSCGGIGTQAVHETLHEEFRLPVGPDGSGVRFCGRTDRGILAEIFTAHQIPLSDPNILKFYEAYTAKLDSKLRAASCEPLAGVRTALESLAGGASASGAMIGGRPILSIMTGNCRRGAEIKLERYGITGFFELERGGYGDHHGARNDLAHATFAQLSQHIRLEQDASGRDAVELRPDEILVIGDTVADIECAHAIGADCLAVATGSIPAAELQQADPRYLVADLTQVAWHPRT